VDTMMQLRNGDRVNNPTVAQRTGALTEPNDNANAHYDLFLTGQVDDDDWFVSPQTDGSLTLTVMSIKEGAEPYLLYDLPGVSQANVLQVWQELQQGEGDKLQAMPRQLHTYIP